MHFSVAFNVFRFRLFFIAVKRFKEEKTQNCEQRSSERILSTILFFLRMILEKANRWLALLRQEVREISIPRPDHAVKLQLIIDFRSIYDKPHDFHRFPRNFVANPSESQHQRSV